MTLFLELEQRLEIRFSIEEMTALSPPKTVKEIETVVDNKLSKNSK